MIRIAYCRGFVGHIFISYSHKDTDYAHQLADTLQAEGFDVWIDERIDYGSQWPYEIQKQLDSCDAFIVIMTPRSFASEWVQSELQRAKRKLKPIFPLLLEGDEPWLSVESTQYYDVRGEKLPDARFYSALGHVVTRPEGQAVQLPADHAEKSLKPKPSTGSPKIRTEIIIAIIGAVATLLAAIVPILWSSLSGRSTPPPTNQATSLPSTSSVSNTSEPGITPTTAISGENSIPSEFTDTNGVPMSLVPEGEFTMGSDTGDPDEGPAHTVYLDAYYIDVYEVTNAFYKACADAGVCQPPQDASSYTRPSYYGNSEFDNYPVLYVDWDMANAYCEWRSAHLPTEAQWEKAARGGGEQIYPWGDEIDESYANYGNKVGDTTAVGTYEKGKNSYGLYDMAGNVWEWVADYYSDTYYSNSPSSNPSGPDSGQDRVLRSGAWEQDDYSVRVPYRLRNKPSDAYYTFGFRCARITNP